MNETGAEVADPVQGLVIHIVAEPTKDDALTAMIAWFDAESKSLGSFYDRMELCNYAEWAARKSIGQDVGDYKGVPQLIFSRV